jgi:hypothetical protein
MRFLPWTSRAAKNEKRDSLEVQGNGFNLGAIWSVLDGGSQSNESDEPVNDATALSSSTVFSCCRVLGDGIASLPCKVYKQTPNGKQEDIDAPLSHLLQFEPNEALQGGSSQGRVAILDNGLTVEKLGLSAEDSELLASRSFSRSEIAAAFRVPASMVGDLTRLSNSNHEQQSLSFVQDSLTPILKRIEIEFRRKLLPPSPIGKPNTSFIMFDLRERLRGDFASTMNGYAVGKQWGFYSTNDVRKELGENPIGPVGDVYWTPVNMQNSELLLDTESIQDQPIGAAPAAPDDTSRQYLRLYRDAVGRLGARSAEKRDLATVMQIFEPLVVSIAEAGAERAKRNTRSPEWQYEPAKIIADYLQKLTERAASRKPEDLDTIAAQELQKVTKTLTLAAGGNTGDTRR